MGDSISTDGVGVMIGLMQLTSLRVRLGLDPDGSGTIGEFLGILGGFDQLARVVAAPGQAWDPSADVARSRMRARLIMAEPLLARIVRR